MGSSPVAVNKRNSFCKEEYQNPLAGFIVFGKSCSHTLYGLCNLTFFCFNCCHGIKNLLGSGKCILVIFATLRYFKNNKN